ncbi:ATP-dependent protease La [Westerdykella ornata]|uniref:Lon protease homolog, mitochondrial n=1 Tax=Westerdykella ornata TaxID=318751 RepID=A0A6A6JQQ6_WESOR|nr:ATP-dependent protease La [Westerdykella ornata]KAF2278717.1 ATP-dependent protease La [Westerdykella ornata]
MYGPWGVVLRRAAVAPATRAPASRATAAFLPSPTSQYALRFYRRPPSPPAALFASRSFSTSSVRLKDRSKDAPDVPEETSENPEEQQKRQSEVVEASRKPERPRESDNLDARSKVPDPIPKSGNGRRAAGARGGGSNDGDGGSGGRRPKQNEGTSAKSVIPEVYPQVMAIPLAKRPLFPGFYKAITIKDPEVSQAIAESFRRGQPYIGAFMLKDDSTDKDVIDDSNEVFDVGTFCQVTSIFPLSGEPNGGISCVLYPHRRIKMSSLIPPSINASGEAAKGEPTVVESTLGESALKDTEFTPSKGDVVASFEEISPEAENPQHYEEPISFLRNRKISIANVENLVEEPFDVKENQAMRALVGEIVGTFKAMASQSNIFRDHVANLTWSLNINVNDDPVKLADFALAVSDGQSEELQEALAEMNVEQRLRKALTVLKREQMTAQLAHKFAEEVEQKNLKDVRRHFLRSQLKMIQQQLAAEEPAGSGAGNLVAMFEERASKLAMPEAVRKIFDDELERWKGMEQQSSEYNVIRNYLDWLTQLPWGKKSVENFDIKHARKVLDEDHYGLKDVKDRILEFIAVGKLRGTVEGKILCMVGPPGVGKTSIGKSIARALNRQYFRLSVGGLHDVSELKGHRRTYVGALPGRIIQALKKCQTENPLIMIDEIDKVGHGIHGDPKAALLELLDPEQNNSFLDQYLDTPVDLSKVLFVCTANLTDTIPPPLLDRMEVIELSGYVADEKLAIAERYLAPAAKEKSGLKDADVQVEKEAILALIHQYCRESGVRNLKKQIEKLYRKAALKIVTDLGEEALPESQALTDEGKAALEESQKDETDVKETPANIEEQTAQKPREPLKIPDTVHVSIGKDQLKDYVGPPIFTSDRMYETTPPGVAMGLAWTALGGSAMYIESILESALTAHSSPGLERTGSLKSVMKESAQVAYSFAKGFLAREFPKNKFFEHARIHLHCPEGATPKDGPSAGITMATSLLSLALDRALPTTIAMTGELTVTGKVLRIGGLREKTVAARRAGAKTIIFPADNLADWQELPEYIREGIEGKPVSWYSDVFNLMFPDLDREAANKLWEKELKSKKGDKKKFKEKPRKEEEEESGDEDD